MSGGLFSTGFGCFISPLALFFGSSKGGFNFFVFFCSTTILGDVVMGGSYTKCVPEMGRGDPGPIVVAILVFLFF